MIVLADSRWTPVAILLLVAVKIVSLERNVLYLLKSGGQCIALEFV